MGFAALNPPVPMRIPSLFVHKGLKTVFINYSGSAERSMIRWDKRRFHPPSIHPYNLV